MITTRDGQNTHSFGAFGVAFLLLLAASVAPTAAIPTPRSGKYVLNDAGQLLWVLTDPNNNGDTDEAALIRTQGGVDTTLFAWATNVSECPGPDGLATGLGAFADMNASGSVAHVVNFGTDDSTRSALFFENGSRTAIVCGDQALETNRTVIAGDGICDIEPMPVVNGAGMVAFGAHVAVANIGTDGCSENSSGAWLANEDKNIYRWSSGAGIEELLNTNRQQTRDTVTVAGGLSIPAGVYAVTDSDVINNVRKTSMNASGQVLVRTNIDNDLADDPTNPLNGCGGLPCDENSAHEDDRVALVLLDGPGSRSFIAGVGPYNSTDPYQLMEDGVLTNGGSVLYKAEGRNDRNPADDATEICGLKRMDDDEGACFRETTESYLNVWTAGATTQVARDGDGLGGGATLQSFSPHYDLNEVGQSAFVAGLDMPNRDLNGDVDFNDPGERCDCSDSANIGDARRVADDCSSGENGDGREGNACQAVLVSTGGVVSEIARNKTANFLASSGVFDWILNGVEFDRIASRVLIQNNGSVFFMIESDDITTGCPLNTSEPPGFDSFNQELTMLVGWTASGGLVEVLREGQLLGADRIVRIYPPEQDSANENGELRVRLDLDQADDNACVPDTPVIITVSVDPGGPDPSIIEVPALSAWGMAAFSMLLVFAGALFLAKRRNAPSA